MKMAKSLVLLVTAIGIAGCGSSDKPTLRVSAAASLQKAFTSYGQQFSQAKARFSFAGSDMLAAQIEQGAKPDVFASANIKLPTMLYAKGLVEKPTVFAANQLVLAVPAGSSKVTGFADVERPGVTLSIGSPTVPVGDYTRTLLSRLPPAQSAAIMSNVKDVEPDVTGIVGKLTQGAVNAGFLYHTDVTATDGKLKAIPIPANLKPTVAYEIAIVKGEGNHPQAQAFIDGVLNGAGHRDLIESGFLPPPSG